MKWNNGHLWTMQYKRSELTKNFEFKFIIKEGNTIIRWEEGVNHVIYICFFTISILGL